MFSLKPSPPAPKLPEDKIDAEYKRQRVKVFAGIFIGYAAYYLVRKNFTLVMPDLIEQGFSKTELGFALSGVSIAYGLSKFLMGNVSDRSDARKFMSIGLALSASLMIAMGLIPILTSSVTIMFIILLLNGWFQGMGWPPSGRVMVHWFSIKERGTKMSIWNLAHNIGGGLIGPLAILGVSWFGEWESKFYLPGVIALAIASIVYLLVRDRPTVCGLPPIEDYKKDYPKDKLKSDEDTNFSAREIFFDYVFNNKVLWHIAIANAFVYLIRYGVLDWAPTYLSEAKQFSLTQTGWAYFLYEWAGIPGTILAGYVSDKWFRGMRGPVSVIYMVLVLLFILIYWQNPAGNPLIDSISLVGIGFLIYGPVMLIGVHALDLVPKKAAGTAAGFTGLFGYLGGAVFANVAMGAIVDSYGWDGGFITLVSACILSIVLILFAWKLEIKLD
ncbi:glycerol-3-phosphate transporter [Fulvivirga lutea]|uniref:Glycerol-3-phosphate transporter n=1 Tax=Fulvivirga lutea TaxID=2810512 RepID=A0A974WJG4_9BACT|nr:glycerol-3-phosphate transporter [Fulvivirga lutea]QSE96468.1 glycerol-3-phosphate transporter [Fulvivirga lutea]